MTEWSRKSSRDVADRSLRGAFVAAAEGDRSENAEYIYRKKQLRQIV